MPVPKRYIAEISQSIAPIARISSSNIYTASNFALVEEILLVPITGTVTPFVFSPQTGVFMMTKVGVVAPINQTSSLSLRKTLENTVVAGPFTSSLTNSGSIHTMTFPSNAREMVALGGQIYHFSSSVITGSLPLTGYITFRRTA